MDRFDESDEDMELQLSWRLDPKESLSDWTIIVESEMTSTSVEYHVHKNILAVGPCRSEYFSSLFRSQMRESETRTSRITLEDVAAQSVPHMLDFVYMQELSNVSSEQAVSLRYLAQYFGIKLLNRKVLAFVKEDMNMSNVHHYIQASKIFHDEKILSMAMGLCIDNIEDLNSSSEVLSAVDPKFFYDMISSPDVDTCSASCHVSKLVATYCKLQQSEINQELFDQLTDRRFIPFIDKESAMMLLELEAATGNNPSSPLSTDTSVTSYDISCLQKRCIKVLAQNWKDLEDVSVIHSFPRNVVAELYERTLATARDDMEKLMSSLKSEIETESKFVFQGLRQAVAEADLCLVQARRECRALEQELEDKNRLLQDRERELLEYRREWSRMVRVPVEHKFERDVKRSTYHHQSSHEPFDNPLHAVGQYGRLRPTAMPTIGDVPEDGYLFVQKNGHYTQRWPLFYYSDR
jgi:BTB/POZ domain